MLRVIAPHGAPGCVGVDIRASRARVLKAHAQASCSTSAPRCCAATPAAPAACGRRLRLAVGANAQRSNSTTKKKLSGPPGLPPINDNNSGGGGGGDGWGKVIRNVALNAVFIGVYFLLDSGSGGPPARPEIVERDLEDSDTEDEPRARRSGKPRAAGKKGKKARRPRERLATA